MSLLSKSRWSRRDLLKRSGMLSAAAAVAPLAGSARPMFADPAVPEYTGSYTDNLYTKIGVRPIINARGTFTIISGSQSLPEVKQAMFEASHYYVHIDELMAAVGKEIAEHMGAPSAIVTNGCCAAIAVATMGCTVGTDPEISTQMPYPKYKTKSEVIVPKYSRNPYDLGIRMSSANIIEVETQDELRAKISEKTAMIYLLSGPRARSANEPLNIKNTCAIAKEKNIPVFVDAAAEEPLYPNIHLEAGATFVGYSGGKCMRGPQAAGILLGPKDLCSAAFWNAAPHHNWGRALKVGKEEAMGMLAAVRMWFKRDHDAEQKKWAEWLTYIGESVKNIPSVTYVVNPPEEDLSNRTSTLTIAWDAQKVGITGLQMVAMLGAGTPRIIPTSGRNGITPGTGRAAGAAPAGGRRRIDPTLSSLTITPYMLQPGEYKIVAETLAKYMKNPGPQPAEPVYSGPTAAVEGTWNVTINYLKGTGHQTFVLKQQGEMLTGEQNGEVYKAQFHGSVKADHVTLSSIVKTPGYQVPYTFTGTVNGNTLSGDVNMGEYWTATFTATKA